MKSVLIIEDDAVLRAATYMVLDEEGFKVKTAENGKEGVELLDKFLFDIVLCDITMPEMDGFQVLSFLKLNLKDSMPVFIFLTNRSEREDFRKGMELGADDYITKPYTREELIKSISVQVQKKEQYFKKYNIEKNILEMLKEKIPNYSIEKKQSSKEIPKSKFNYEASIFLTDGKKSDFVKLSNLVFITSNMDYTRVYVKNNKPFVIRKPIKVWEDDLPKDHFIRIHRSTIINTDYIKKVEKGKNYSHKVFLEDVSEPVEVSQRYFRKFKKQMNQR